MVHKLSRTIPYVLLIMFAGVMVLFLLPSQTDAARAVVKCTQQAGIDGAKGSSICWWQEGQDDPPSPGSGGRLGRALPNYEEIYQLYYEDQLANLDFANGEYFDFATGERLDGNQLSPGPEVDIYAQGEYARVTAPFANEGLNIDPLTGRQIDPVAGSGQGSGRVISTVPGPAPPGDDPFGLKDTPLFCIGPNNCPFGEGSPGELDLDFDGANIGLDNLNIKVNEDGSISISGAPGGAQSGQISGQTGIVPVHVLNQLVPVSVKTNPYEETEESRDKSVRQRSRDLRDQTAESVMNTIREARRDPDTNAPLPAFVQNYYEEIGQNSADKARDNFRSLAQETLYLASCAHLVGPLGTLFGIQPPADTLSPTLELNKRFRSGKSQSTFAEQQRCVAPEIVENTQGEQVPFTWDDYRRGIQHVGGYKTHEALLEELWWRRAVQWGSERATQIDLEEKAVLAEIDANEGYFGVRGINEAGEEIILSPGILYSGAQQELFANELFFLAVTDEESDEVTAISNNDIARSVIGIFMNVLNISEKWKTLIGDILDIIGIFIPNPGIPGIPDVPPLSLRCQSSVSSALPGQSITFSAVPTDEEIFDHSLNQWNAGTNASPVTQTGGSIFTTSFSVEGSYLVDVRNSGTAETATCGIEIGFDFSTDTPTPTPIPSPDPGFLVTCSPDRQTVSVGQSVTVTANGGSGTYEWEAPGGSPSGQGGGSSFTTAYFGLPDRYIIEVFDAQGTDFGTCEVVVEP